MSTPTPDLEDVGVAERLGDEALDRVEKAAREEFLQAVVDAVEIMPAGFRFNSDRLWLAVRRAGVPHPREPRAMGAAVRRAARAGLCVPKGYGPPSTRAASHRRPLRVWERT